MLAAAALLPGRRRLRLLLRQLLQRLEPRLQLLLLLHLQHRHHAALHATLPDDRGNSSSSSRNRVSCKAAMRGSLTSKQVWAAAGAPTVWLQPAEA